MKFGRVPTTERTRIALPGQLLDGEDRDRDRHDEADDPDRMLGIAAARPHDAVSGAQAEPLDGHAARERILEGVPLVQPLALPLDAGARELRVLRGPARRHQRIGHDGAGGDGVIPGMLHFAEYAPADEHFRVNHRALHVFRQLLAEIRLPVGTSQKCSSAWAYSAKWSIPGITPSP